MEEWPPGPCPSPGLHQPHLHDLPMNHNGTWSATEEKQLPGERRRESRAFWEEKIRVPQADGG